jgi:hypothetical protein
VSGKELEDAYKEIEEKVNERFQHKGSYADHYHYDKLLSKALDKHESEFRKLLEQAKVQNEITQTQDEVVVDANYEKQAKFEAEIEKLTKEVATLKLQIQSQKPGTSINDLESTDPLVPIQENITEPVVDLESTDPLVTEPVVEEQMSPRTPVGESTTSPRRRNPSPSSRRAQPRNPTNERSMATRATSRR